MFRRSYRLPLNLAGIPLYLDVSFLFVLPLMVWLTARNLSALVHMPHLGLDLDPAAFGGLVPLALGMFSVIGLFACIVLHELGHSLVARRYGVRVRRITLWFLGGVAEFEEMPRQRGAEAIVAIAGPIVSFALAAIFWILTSLVPRTVPTVWLVVWYLWVVNLMLGLFNLIPAMPLDGGRILRSLLALRMPHVRATALAGNIAKVVAVLLGIWGVLTFNIWTMVLAFFVFSAASRETEYSVVTEMLRGIQVRDLMNRDVRTVPAGMNVGELGRYMILHHHKGFPVVDDLGRLVGTIGVDQIQHADPAVPVWTVMSSDIRTIDEDASALDAFTRMGGNGFGRLIVLDISGNMVGILTRADLMRAIQVRMLGLGLDQWEPAIRQGPRPHVYVPPAVTPAYTPPPPGYAAPGPSPYTSASDAPGNRERHARPI